MIGSYFKIACRHLLKSRVFSLINIMALAVGMIAFVLIIEYISFEMSFDRFHTNRNLIYRVGLNRYVNESLQHSSARTFAGLRKFLRENAPEVENATGFYKTPANTGFLFSVNGKIFNEGGGILNTDQSFFKVFPSLLARGDANSVLDDPNNLVISETMAKKLFGTADPLGQRIQRIDDYEKGSDFIISGILKDIPPNAHFHATFIRHIDDTWPDQDDWKESYPHTYITLPEGTDPAKVEARVNRLLARLTGKYPLVKDTEMFLQPLSAIHLSSHFDDELEFNGSKTMVYLLGFIGLVILIMAWINYINLETARFLLRAREMGVRRIIGSDKIDLMLQFLIEYFCLTVCAVAAGGLLLYVVHPYISAVVGIPIKGFEWLAPEVWLAGVAVFISGSIIVGIYPAIFLFRFNPVNSIKGRVGTWKEGIFMRKTLVVVQFTASLVLIAFVMLVRSQLDFMRSTNKKMEIEHVIALRNPTAYSHQELDKKHSDYKVFENRLLQGSTVKMVASSSAIPGAEIGFTYVNLIKRDTNDAYDPTIYKTLFVDHNFFPAYGLHVISGRNFPDPFREKEFVEPWLDENWNTIVLNEAAIRKLGFTSPEDAIDQTVHFRLFDYFLEYTIIGVVADYHHEAIKKEIFPTIFALNYSTFQQVYYSVRLYPGADPGTAIEYIRETWQELFPEKPFEYFFLDEYYDQQFKSELYFGRIFSLFAGIAIFIASLGILGMTLFEANARVKEISIRKILGASISGLMSLLTAGHIRVLTVSAMMAAPVFYYISSQWLSNYPVRIGLSMEFFLVPILVIIVMVVLTSFFQTWKAVSTNPVDQLKHE